MATHPSDTAPFFIVGFQRSGTTLLKLMLNAHPNLAVPNETAFISDFFQKRDEYGDLAFEANARRMLADIAESRFVRKGKLIDDVEGILKRPRGSYADLVDAIFTQYAAARGKTRWGEKTPGQEMCIDVLNSLFPSCRIIHIVRDGRDVALSLRRVSWGTSDLPRVAADWRWRTTVARKVGGVLNERYCEVRYEDLVHEPRAHLERICTFLGEQFDERMLDYWRTAAEELPQSSREWDKSALEPPDVSKVFSWRTKMPRSDQLIFDRIAGPALDLFGYERVRDYDRVVRYAARLKAIGYALHA
jgi:hypothetical protein